MNVKRSTEELEALKPVETWRQHPAEPDLWIGKNNVLANTAALNDRTTFYNVIRVPAGRSASPFDPEAWGCTGVAVPEVLSSPLTLQKRRTSPFPADPVW